MFRAASFARIRPLCTRRVAVSVHDALPGCLPRACSLRRKPARRSEQQNIRENAILCSAGDDISKPGRNQQSRQGSDVGNSATRRVLARQGKLSSAALRRADTEPEWMARLLKSLGALENGTALMEYLRSSYPKVHGYLELPMAAVLGHLSSFQHHRGWGGSCVEIGVFNGASFFPIVLTTKDGEVAIGIDCFEDQEANVDDSGFGASVPSAAAFEAALRKHIMDDATRKRAVVMRRDSSDLESSEVLEWLPTGHRVRLFSVDGCHTARATEKDCSLAAACLAPGGVIMVDDVFNSHWPSVAVGLIQFLQSHKNMIPFFVGFNKVLICDANHHSDYISEVQKLPSFCKMAEFGDHTVTVHRQGWLASMYGND